MAVKKANSKKTTVKKTAAKKPVVKKQVIVEKQSTKQQMVSFEQAFKNYWLKYFDFKGCAQRSEFWWMWLFNMCVSLFVYLIEIGISKQLAGGLNIVWSLATFIPGMSLLVRRLHDVGFSGWWVLLFIILMVCGMFSPIFAIIWFLMSLCILVLLVLPSKFDGNNHRK
jgi:uncharacterized membrane protein YhaH (DUF805 family)